VTATATPRVAAPGAAVRLAGECAGSGVTVVFRGQPAGWYDAPVVFANVTPPIAAGRWSVDVTMPATPATIDVTCIQNAVPTFASTRVAPSGLPTTLPQVTSGEAADLTLPTNAYPESVEAFTDAGVPIPLTVTTGYTVRVTPPSGAGHVVIVGTESLGENANALQNNRVQAWSAPVRDLVAPTTTTTPAPSTTVAATVPSTAPAPSTTVGTTPRVAGELATTGSRSVHLALVGVGMVAVGIAATAGARRRRPLRTG